LKSVYAVVAVVALSTVSLLASISPASAQKSGFFHQEAEFASNSGNLAYLAGAIFVPVLTHENDGSSASIRAVDSLGTTLAITEILKDVSREKRPDSNSLDSFPSGHTSAAFSVATIESTFYPHQAPYWFAGATLIGASRLQLNRHHLQDVLAGAAIGFGTSKWEVSQRHGLILAPFISPTGSGLTVNFNL